MAEASIGRASTVLDRSTNTFSGAPANELNRKGNNSMLKQLLLAGISVFSIHHEIRAEGVLMNDIYRISDAVFDSHVEYHKFDIPKGKEVPLAELKGPGKTTFFYITDDSGGNLYQGLVLKIFWDGEKEPSVNVPLWDFFNVFEGKTIDYQSRLSAINHMCYMNSIPMPFSESARFILVNDGDRDYSQVIAYGIDYEKSDVYANEKSRLHCAWRRSNPTSASLHTFFETTGTGHYIGNFLHVHSRYGDWWGEGDTIFHVDGKAITHTPGTEDEYGSCWAFERTFSYLDLGYIQMEGGKNRMYRWYFANPVRFKDSLKVEIQNQRWQNHQQVPSTDDFMSVAFWYQDPARGVMLQPYAERVAPSKAIEYPKKPE